MSALSRSDGPLGRPPRVTPRAQAKGSGSWTALRGGLMVCGTTSDAGKSFVVAGLCRLLARNGVRVAPFKGQNMANNAVATADGAEIGHAQWAQATAAGVEPATAMNPVLLKPTSERTSQVVVRGRPLGEMSAAQYHQAKPQLRAVVLDALAELRADHDVVLCEGAGSPAEINLLDGDIVNLAVAEAAGLPAVVVGDIDRGGVFAALYGTVELLPGRLRQLVRGFIVNKLRGDPALLGSACDDLEARCGVPTLGVLPHLPGPDLDGEDSLTLDNHTRASGFAHTSGFGAESASRTDARSQEVVHASTGHDLVAGHGRAQNGVMDALNVAAVRWPLVSNAGDLDPLALERGVQVRWVRSVAELGDPDLIVLPGSKATRSDLDWFRRSGLSEAVRQTGKPVIAVCAGLQMCGEQIDDPTGAEGPPGSVRGLGWLPLVTTFEPEKVLDRPVGRVVAGPGGDEPVAGYRIHHGRISVRNGTPRTWLLTPDGAPLGWYVDPPDGQPVLGTTLHALFENDGLREALLGWVAARTGKRWSAGGLSFASARASRFDHIADLLEAHLDIPQLLTLIESAAPALPRNEKGNVTT